MNTFNVVFVCLFVICGGNDVDFSLTKYGFNCDLEWIEHHSGSEGSKLPEEMIKYSEMPPITYVVRVRYLGSHAVGTMLNGTAKFPYGEEVVRPRKFEILTNPNNCSVAWVPPHFMNQQGLAQNFVDTLVTADEKEGQPKIYVGRHLLNNSMKHEGCGTTKNLRSCGSIPGCEFQVLQSLQRKMPYGLSEVSVDVPENDRRGKLFNKVDEGVDKIVNKANVEVTSTTFSSESKSESNRTRKASTLFLGVEKLYTAGTNGDTEESETLSSWDSSRTINVGPLSSVEMCSGTPSPIVRVDIDADAEFSVEGISGDVLMEMLKAEGYPGPFTVVGNTVRTKVVKSVEVRTKGNGVQLRSNPSFATEERTCSLEAFEHGKEVENFIKECVNQGSFLVK